jgi:hypothetical protein
MENNYGLPKEVIDELKKEIRKHRQYQVLQERKNMFVVNQNYALAMQTQEMIDRFEKKHLDECVRIYLDSVKNVGEMVKGMNKDDMDMMCAYGYSVVMLADSLDTILIEIEQLMKKYYPDYKIHAFDKLKELGKESKNCLSLVEGLGGNDPYYMNLYGDSADKLTEMIVNKAKSFLNKVNRHEESINKKAKRNVNVA